MEILFEITNAHGILFLIFDAVICLLHDSGGVLSFHMYVQHKVLMIFLFLNEHMYYIYSIEAPH